MSHTLTSAPLSRCTAFHLLVPRLNVRTFAERDPAYTHICDCRISNTRESYYMPISVSQAADRSSTMDEEEEHLLPCSFSPGAYVEVAGHMVFGDGYEGSWHGAKVVRCHQPTRGRAHWTYDIELVERAAQARQRRQIAAHIPADALRPHCPVQPFSDFCRLEPGLVVEHMLPEAPSVWWLGVVVQLEGCPTKDALVAYPVTPREAPGVAHTATQLRPAFYWDSEMSCWCSIWQSPHGEEADVQKCFNSHFKKYMGLPKCARVGGVVPHVQAVGTDYISDVPSPFDVSPEHSEPAAINVSPAGPDAPAVKTLPPLAAMPPRQPVLPPMPNMDSFPSSAPPANYSNVDAAPVEPPRKKRQTLEWGVPSAAEGTAQIAPAMLEPCAMQRSHSGSISATHQPSALRREAGCLEATRSDAKFLCAGDKPSSRVDQHLPDLHGGPWKMGMPGNLCTAGQRGLGSAWQQPFAADHQGLYAQQSGMPNSGGPATCSHSRAELKKHVSRAQLMRSSSCNKGIPGSVQLAAALRAAPDCSSPHAMESAATAAMLLYDGRDSGGSGSAVCASSDLSGIGTAERCAAGRMGVMDDAAAAAVAGASGQWELLTGSRSSLARALEGKGLASAAAAQLPETQQPVPPSAAAVMQSRSKREQASGLGGSGAQKGKLGTADSLRLLADVREQEDAAVGLLCLRHHQDGLGAGEPGSWACTK